MKLPLRIGSLVVVSDQWLDELDQKLLSVKGSGGKVLAENERLEAVVRRQAELLHGTRLERDLALAKARETNEALGETLDDLERYRSIIRHPVSRPPQDGG